MERNFKNSVLLLLFFIKIGCFTFGGGWSILAQMEQEFIDKRHWITKDELVEITAMGRSIPGIMIVNISMLFGYRVLGTVGGVCCVVGITIPAIVILSLITWCYHMLKDNFWLGCALRGLGCVVVSIVGNAVLFMGKTALKDKFSVVVCGIAFLLCFFVGVSNFVLVSAGAALALLMMGVNRHRLH